MEIEELLRTKPWFTSPVLLAGEPVGMLGNREALLCYYLAKDGFTGSGAIVDAGSFLGKSAFYFAHGLRANPRCAPERRRVHCFDNFLINEEATVEFMARRLNQTFSIGDSTRPIFDVQTAAICDALEVHAGDLHQATWQNEPIEILMVDIAKSKSLGKRVVELFFQDLIPKESVVIHQDYHHPWLPHIHIVMEYLADYFELVAPRVDDSALFRFAKRIPRAVLQRAIDYNFTQEEQMRLMDSAISRLPPDDRLYVQLARIVLRCGSADEAALRRELDELETRFNRSQSDYSCNPYFGDVRLYIDELEGWRQKEAGNNERCLELADGILQRRPIPRIRTMRGCALIGLGRFVDAERELRTALETRPAFGFAYLELGRALMCQGRFADAEAVLLAGLRNPEAVEATPRHYLELLGEIWCERADPAQPENGTMAILRSEMPDNPEVWALDAVLHHYRGEYQAADASLRSAIELGLPPDRASELLR